MSYFIALIRPVNIYLGTLNMHRESIPLEAFVWHITSKTRTVLAFALTSGAINSIDPPCDVHRFAVASYPVLGKGFHHQDALFSQHLLPG